MIEVIISTINSNIFLVPRQFLLEQPDIRYLIIHQDPDGTFDESTLPPEFSRPDVRYKRYTEKGLPLSRNRGVECALGDILLLTDDDVILEPDALRSLGEVFRLRPEVDILTFCAKLPNGRPFKKYRNGSYTHNFRTLLQVSSIEFAVRRSSAERLGLRWDKDFGLGAKYGGGLEVVFLKECLDKKAVIEHVPLVIATHPPETSGRNLNEKNGYIRGAVFARIFGRFAWVLCLAFVARKRIQDALKVDAFVYLKEMLRGVKDFRSSQQG